MDRSESITIFQLILISMTAVGLKNHVSILSPLVQTSGRDAWLSVIIVLCLALVWIPLLLFIHNKTDQEHLYGWMKKQVGRVLSFILVFFTSIFFLIPIIVTLKESIIWTKASYLPNTPTFFLALFLSILCFSLAISGIQAIAIVNFFVLFFVVIFGFFVGITNFQFKEFALLTPFLENGYNPIFRGMIFPASGIVELIAFIFVQHKIKNPFRYKHFMIITFILSWLTLGPLIGSIVEFGPVEAARQQFPAFEEWSLVRITRFIEHVDFLSIYQWLSGTFIRTSFLLFVLTELFQLKSNKTKAVFMVVVLGIVFSFMLVEISNMEFYNLMRDLFLPFTFYTFFSLSVLLGLIVFLFRKKEQGVVS